MYTIAQMEMQTMEILMRYEAIMTETLNAAKAAVNCFFKEI